MNYSYTKKNITYVLGSGKSFLQLGEILTLCLQVENKAVQIAWIIYLIKPVN